MTENRDLSHITATETEKTKPIYEAVIVLGKNLNLLGKPRARAGTKDVLSAESKMSALAALQMYKSGQTQKIIFSGGKTSGPEWNSEAASMRSYIFARANVMGLKIPEDHIILEEKSFDTATNAREVAKLLGIDDLNSQDAGTGRTDNQKLALITTANHLPRASRLFEAYGIKTHGIRTEEILKTRSQRHHKLGERYKKDLLTLIDGAKETILNFLLKFDPKGEALQKATKHRTTN